MQNLSSSRIFAVWFTSVCTCCIVNRFSCNPNLVVDQQSPQKLLYGFNLQATIFQILYWENLTGYLTCKMLAHLWFPFLWNHNNICIFPNNWIIILIHGYTITSAVNNTISFLRNLHSYHCYIRAYFWALR